MAQVIFHGVQVVEVGVQVRVHQDRGVEEDGEGQVEVEREVEEVKENDTCATWRIDFAQLLYTVIDIPVVQDERDPHVPSWRRQSCSHGCTVVAFVLRSSSSTR